MKLFTFCFLLIALAAVAVAQPCPEPIPLFNSPSCTPGPGLYLQKSVREFVNTQKAYAPAPVTIHEVAISIQSGNASTAQYAVSLTIEKSNGATATQHLVAQRSVGMWTKVYFLCEDFKKTVSVSIQELAPPVDFSLAE